MNQSIRFSDTVTGDYKLIKRIKMDIVVRYVCAFLNSHGGILYIGISNDGTVKGIKINREVIIFEISGC